MVESGRRGAGLSEAGTGQSRAAEILERAAAFYAGVLWDTAEGKSVRARLARAGIDEQSLRDFGVGYAPSQGTELTDHLSRWGYSDEELVDAGIAFQSERGHLHVHFRSRVMFGVRDRDGVWIGFAGLATHSGPSWPRWVTPPESERYRRGRVLFGIDRAAPAISAAGRAIVVSDCLDAIRLHGQGHAETVAVVRTNVTSEHLDVLAPELGAEPGRLNAESRRLGDSEIAAIVVNPAPAGEEPRRLDSEGVVEAKRREERTGVIPDVVEKRSPGVRAIQAVIALVVGVSIPSIAVALTDPGSDTGDEALAVSLAVIAATYLMLALVAGVVSGRVRARSRSRRMKEAWERSLTEWQPTGWTYHVIEEILVGAALISVLTLAVLMFTVGGFVG